jgi:hypothetical protein
LQLQQALGEPWGTFVHTWSRIAASDELTLLCGQVVFSNSFMIDARLGMRSLWFSWSAWSTLLAMLLQLKKTNKMKMRGK